MDDLDNLDDADARALWKPMNGTEPVSVVELDGRRALRMPCRFSGDAVERASWDREVSLDLSMGRGMRFDFNCANPAPVSTFSFFLRSGAGWYAATFSPPARDGWGEVTLDKSDFRTEGTPAGWGAIDAIRISAWRGGNHDTVLHVANLAPYGTDAAIVLARGDPGGSTGAGEARASAQFAASMADRLDNLGLPFVVLSDRELTSSRLKGRSIVILPYNPALSADTSAELIRFMNNGGKLLAFYALPGDLAVAAGFGGGAHVRQARAGQFAEIRAADKADERLPAMPGTVRQASWNIRRTDAVPGRSRVAATWFDDKGTPTGEAAVLASDSAVFMTHVLLDDDPARQRALLLSMLGALDPGLLDLAVDRRLNRVARFGVADTFDTAVKRLRGIVRGHPEAQRALDDAEKARREALRFGKRRQYELALAGAEQAQERLLDAYCLGQEPLAGEHRAWWCHDAYGLPGRTWDEAIRILAENGFTAVIPNMLWGGAAYYDSAVLPAAAAVRDRGDAVAECLAACRKHGIECHVWKVNWNMGWNAPAPFAERMRREGRTQVGFDGTPEPKWLCPSHPENRKLEIEAMVEVATRYDVDGIHFDYIRYPDGDHCFCAGCRERFEKIVGAAVKNWPADVRRDSVLRGQWLDFRRDNITTVVAAVHERVKAAKPRVKISAAVFPNWPVDRDGIGQDWKLWCERGYLDFVCPMNYTPGEVQFESLASRQGEWAGSVPVYPGIGLSTWAGERDVVKLIGRVRITRKLGTGGFTVFNYGVPEADRVVPQCGKGLTRRR